MAVRSDCIICDQFNIFTLFPADILSEKSPIEGFIFLAPLVVNNPSKLDER